MKEAICPACKNRYHSSSTNYPRNRVCPVCGCVIEFRNDEKQVTVFDIFNTEKYQISKRQEEWEDLCTKNLLIYMNLN